MNYYLKLFKSGFKISIMTVIIYRVNTLLMLIQNIIYILTTIFSIEFIYNFVTEIGQWRKPEIIILICSAQIINAIYRGILRQNLDYFSRSIRDGRFDFLLLKPTNLFYSIMFGNVDFSSLFSVFVPIYIIYLQLSEKGIYVSPLNVLCFVLFLILGVLLITALMIIIYSASFIFINTDKFEQSYYIFMDILNKPKDIFSKYLSYILFFLIPLVPIANTPVMALLGKGDMKYYIGSVSVSLAFIVLAILAFKTGLKRYESASS